MIKSEKEEHFVINLDKSKIVKSKVDEGLLNSVKIRNIKEEVNENSSMFQCSNQANQNGPEWQKVEPASDFKAIQEKWNKTTSKSSNRNVKVQCKFCNIKVSKSNHPRHMMALHFHEIQNLLLNCLFCNQQIFNKANLTVHMKKIHPKESFEQKSARFECDLDGKVYCEKCYLSYHMKVHLPKVMCKICKTELSHNYISEHLKQVHAIGRNFQCDICNLNFKTSVDLKNHKRVHNKKFECQICKKLFPTKVNLNQHNKYHHENPNSFECEICGKKFNERYYLRKHQKVHDKNRPKRLKCQCCEYTTDGIKEYKNHQKYHEKLDKKFAGYKNPIKCEKCPKLFRDRRFLQYHLRIVHPKVPFQCDLCGNYFSAKSSIKVHIETHMRQRSKLTTYF